MSQTVIDELQKQYQTLNRKRNELGEKYPGVHKTRERSLQKYKVQWNQLNDAVRALSDVLILVYDVEPQYEALIEEII